MTENVMGDSPITRGPDGTYAGRLDWAGLIRRAGADRIMKVDDSAPLPSAYEIASAAEAIRLLRYLLDDPGAAGKPRHAPPDEETADRMRRELAAQEERLAFWLEVRAWVVDCRPPEIARRLIDRYRPQIVFADPLAYEPPSPEKFRRWVFRERADLRDAAPATDDEMQEYLEI